MNDDQPAILALDIGGSHVQVGLVIGGTVEVLGDTRREPHTPVVNLPALIDRAGAVDGYRYPAAVGISIAGMVDAANRVVVASENLGAAAGSLLESIEHHLGVPVYVETDVFCFGTVVGEAYPTGTTLLLVVGTGIGHCVLLEGRPAPGRSRQANRFGHITVEPHGRPCYCGRRGCVCQYAAGSALMAAAAAGRIDEAEDRLAVALGSAIHVLGPDRVVLAGGAIEAGAFDLERLAERTADYCADWMIPPLLRSEIAHAPLAGAARVALNHLRKDRR